VLTLAQTVAEKGSRLAVSDAGIAGVLGEAAVEAAAFNVWINLASSENVEYRTRTGERIQRLIEEAHVLRQRIAATTRSRME
jgi:formiminotetrahydrofolate cyclodeaminase